MDIRLYGSDGVLHYDLMHDRIWGASRHGGQSTVQSDDLEEIAIPEERARGWRVEADFVESIRSGAPVRFTDFATGVAYMEFTEAVARSAQRGEAVELPLAEFVVNEE
jgi:predicted dehydrogenase